MEASQRRFLAREAARLGCPLDAEGLDRLSLYAETLGVWNSKVRLLGDRDPGLLISKHIPDCLALSRFLPDSGMIADIGSGAGLPGLILACVRPELRFLLIESRAKRASFLFEATARLGLDRVCVLGSRAEDVIASSEYRETADLVTGRAVAIGELATWGRPLLRAPSGMFMTMHSGGVSNGDLETLAKDLRLVLRESHGYELSTGESRRIAIFRLP